MVIIALLITGWYWYDNKEEPLYGKGAVPTSADNTPPGIIHNIPVPDAVAAARSIVAEKERVDEGVVIVMSAYEREWPNACLGLEAKDEMCAQVITPGFEVIVQVSTTGERFTYRTNDTGSMLREE